MSIISTIGRKSFKVKILFGVMYAFLAVGSLSMIYPFLLMISGSLKDSVDSHYLNIVPKYLFNDQWLYKKHISSLFNENIIDANIAYDEKIVNFDNISFPKQYNKAILEEWNKFRSKSNIPSYAFTGGYLRCDQSGTIPDGLRNFKKYLKQNYGKNIASVNEKLKTEFVNWNSLFIQPPRCLLRRENPSSTPFAIALRKFQASFQDGMRVYASPSGGFKNMFLKAKYSDDIDEYNKVHNTKFKSYAQVPFVEKYANNKTRLQAKDWENFVRNILALQWIRIDKDAKIDFQKYLKVKYNQITNLNKHYNTTYKSFREIKMSPKAPHGIALSDWSGFITGWSPQDSSYEYKVKAKHLYINSIRWRFVEFLKQKYTSLRNLNNSLQTNFKKWVDISIPQRQIHYQYFNSNKSNIRWRLIIRNYLTVFEYLLLHGRGLYNTAVYCGLTVLSALIINPLAAYAMSRYKLPSTYKILLFMMCTMAFPPMVTAIPSFLILRKLDLLNTFGALILPTMANGYLIFLLKGFFDSLPRELYESAQIDGAGEWILFWQITMSLSKPILAVVALQAFNAAYSNFMFAFVVCQDEKMWTLMVWLYQLQQRCGQSVMYASLIIAAIPTFIIFLFCQNIIMRGIVIPVEK